MLARQGHRVVLFERERFPAPTSGSRCSRRPSRSSRRSACATPSSAAGCLKKFGATMVWGRDPAPWSWYFRETNVRYPHAYQVWRPQFDQILLDASRAAGADVREGSRWRRSASTAAGPPACVTADGAVRRRRLRGGRLRPGGRCSAMRRASAAGTRLPQHGGLRLLRGRRRRLDPPDETNILVESYGEGWFWVIPLHVGVVSVGAVVDAPTVAPRVRGDALAGSSTAADRPHRAPRRLLAGARLVDGPYSLRDWSYTSDRTVGRRLDPRRRRRLLRRPVVLLRRPPRHVGRDDGVRLRRLRFADPVLAAAAAPVYQELYYSQYYRFHELAKLFYASNARSTATSGRPGASSVTRSGGRSRPGPRSIRAVAGQSAHGYERMVLAGGALPSDVDRAIAAWRPTSAGPAVVRAGPGAGAVRLRRRRCARRRHRPRRRAGRRALRVGRRSHDRSAAPEKVPISPLVAAVSAPSTAAAPSRRSTSGWPEVTRRGQAAFRSHLPSLVETMHAEGILELRR